VNEKYWIEQYEGEGEKGNTQARISNSSRIPEPIRDAPIGIDLVCFDRHLEDCLSQYIQQAAAEEPECYSCRDVAAPEIHTRPYEVHDDVQIRELDSKPHIRSACQQLKPTTEPFGQV
jgi:hypothetical protein